MFQKRKLDLKPILAKKSCFLFGPRQTGKSSLIQHTLSTYKQYSLLDSETYLLLNQNPKRLEQQLTPQDQIIIIDEIQKLPHLLDEVHLLIEKYNVRFLLTGSSTRKLRRGGVNLLGGRARSRMLHPFIYEELKKEFDLIKALKFGSLPSIYFSDAPLEDLRSYTGDYLREEIASEALVRNIPAFSRFLEIAALCNGQLINYTKISNDAQVPNTTVQEYFQILKDTLIAFEVPAWKKSLRRKPIQTSKFYFFDIGVARYLQHRFELPPKTPEFGDAFESYIAHELKAFCDYTDQGELCYWRSASGYEVDFILNDAHAIEVKAKEILSEQDLKGLIALREEKKLQTYTVICMEKHSRVVNGIHIQPWKEFLTQLWNQENPKLP